nr:D-glycerate dehydrogenase [uncultured Bacillus sp.]
MSKYKVVSIGRIFPAALKRLEEVCEIKMWDKPEPIPQELLYEWLSDAEGLRSRGDFQINNELLEQAPNLRVIAQTSVGYDNVDIDACSKRGIPFGNTPGVLIEATADLAFGLVLSSARRIHEGWNFVQAGKWTKENSFPFGVDLFGKSLGIIGMGSIGTAVAKRAKASGMKVIYHNRTKRQDDDLLGVRYVSFEELLAQSDFLVVLVPLSEKTFHLFSEEQFSIMKSTAYFINAARGGIVDTNALYEALVKKEIAYAALDVTDPEPLQPNHPLLSLPNILITPHIGSATIETRTSMHELTADNLLAGLERKKLPACVNREIIS